MRQPLLPVQSYMCAYLKSLVGTGPSEGMDQLRIK